MMLKVTASEIAMMYFLLVVWPPAGNCNLPGNQLADKQVKL